MGVGREREDRLDDGGPALVVLCHMGHVLGPAAAIVRILIARVDEVEASDELVACGGYVVRGPGIKNLGREGLPHLDGVARMP